MILGEKNVLSLIYSYVAVCRFCAVDFLIIICFSLLISNFSYVFKYSFRFFWGGGYAVALLVEALRYKSEGRGLDSRWCHWPHYGPGVDSASNRNEYQEYFLGGNGGRCTGLQPYHLHVPTVLKSGSLNLLEPSRPVQTCNGIALPFTYLSEVSEVQLHVL